MDLDTRNSSEAPNPLEEKGEIDYSSLETLDFWPQQIILICMYSFVAIVSLALNSLTIVVLVKCDKIYSELNLYLINLSVSDIVVSVLCIPFTYSSFILNRWVFPHFICPFVNFAQICSVLVNIWTMTVIGIERYHAIVHPLQSIISAQRNKLVSIVIIWLVAVCSGWVQLVYSRVIPIKYANETLYDCRENLPELYSKLYTIYLFVSAFALPLFILIYVYSVIGYRVWHHVSPTKLCNSHVYEYRKKVTKMSLLIVCLFFLCWCPLQMFTILAAFVDNFLYIRTERDYRQLVYGYLVAHILAMLHSVVNPIVYCLFSRKFWQCFTSQMDQFCLRIDSLCCHTRPHILAKEAHQTARSNYTKRQSLDGEPV